MAKQSTSGAARPPAAVVDALGFGRAQIIALVIGGGGVQFCDGMLLAMVNDVAKSMARDFGVGGQERALMTTAMFVGIFVGTLSIGSFGDSLGRRPTILLSYGVCAVFIAAASLATNFQVLVLAAGLAGVGAGLGVPPSVALLSEISPKRFRIAMRVAAGFFFVSGQMLIVSFLAEDDSQLVHIHWRIQMAIMALFPTVLGLIACCLLQESPVFLAATGRHDEAAEGLERIRRLNGANGVELLYDAGGDGELGSVQTAREKVMAIFSERRRPTTLSLMFGLFGLQLYLYGNMYAAPLILRKAGSKDVTPTDQLMMNLSTTLMASIFVGVVAQSLPRKGAVTAALCGSVATSFLFAFAGSQPKPRSVLMDMFFQAGSTCAGPAIQLGLVVGYQIAVEAYPASVAATSSSLIQGAGRLGAAIAAQQYELMTRATGSWTVFFYFLSVLQLCGAFGIAVWMRLPREDELSPKGGKNAAHYGASGDSQA